MSTQTDPQTQAALAANKIASAAMGISIAALLMAYLQLLLGNIMSGNALWKTNHAAIGVSASHRSWIPGLRRLKIRYPQINFRIRNILFEIHESADRGIVNTFMSSFAKHHGYEWRRIPSGDWVSSKHISDGTTVLCEANGRPLQVGILPVPTRLYYQLWRLVNPIFSPDRPRATWAQVIQALGITDTSSLVVNKLDADTIPSGIDVPIQRLRLFDLGRLALIMGCTTVEIDVMNRFFRAVGPFCTLSTDDIPTFGKAIRFEGDIYAINRDKWRFQPVSSMFAALELAEGRLAVSRYLIPSMTSFTHHNYWDLSSWESTLSPVNLVFQAETLDACERNTELALEHTSTEHISHPFQKWQLKTVLTIPSMVAVASYAGLPNAFCGFPSGVLLSALKGWVQVQADEITQQNNALPNVEKAFNGSISAWRYLRVGEIAFLERRSQIVMTPVPWYTTAASGLEGQLGWAYARLPQELRDSIWGPPPSHPTPVWSRGTGLVMPPCLLLLERYDPAVWAEDIRKQYRDIEGELHPSKVLWFQTLLIDIAIRLQIRGKSERAHDEDKRRESVPQEQGSIPEAECIVKAIASSCLWNLEGSYLDQVPSPKTEPPQDQHPRLGLQGPISVTELQPPEAGYVGRAGTLPSPRSNDTLQTEAPRDEPPHPITECAHSSPQPTRPTPRDEPPESSSPEQRREYVPWDLHRALLTHCDFYSQLKPEQAELEHKRLAILLKLRALFFIAFLMSGPDSSQVFDARHSQAQVPMI